MNKVYATSIRASQQALRTSAAVAGKLDGRSVTNLPEWGEALLVTGLIMVSVVAVVAIGGTLAGQLQAAAPQPAPAVPHPAPLVAQMTARQFGNELTKAIKDPSYGTQADGVQDGSVRDQLIARSRRELVGGGLFSDEELGRSSRDSVLVFACVYFASLARRQPRGGGQAATRTQVLEAYARFRTMKPTPANRFQFLRALGQGQPLQIDDKSRALARLIDSELRVTHFEKLGDLAELSGEHDLIDKPRNAIICHLLGRYVDLQQATVERVFGTLPEEWGSEQEIRAAVLRGADAGVVVLSSEEVQRIVCALLWRGASVPFGPEYLKYWVEKFTPNDGVFDLNQPAGKHCFIEQRFGDDFNCADLDDEAADRIYHFWYVSADDNWVDSREKRIDLVNLVRQNWIDASCFSMFKLFIDSLSRDTIKMMKQTPCTANAIWDKLSGELRQRLLGIDLNNKRHFKVLQRYWLIYQAPGTDAWLKVVAEDLDGSLEDYQRFIVDEICVECAWHVCHMNRKRVLAELLQFMIENKIEPRKLRNFRGKWSQEEFDKAVKDIMAMNP